MNETNFYAFSNRTKSVQVQVPLWAGVFQILFNALVMVIGVPGNSLVIYVQYKNNRKSSTDYLVLTMSCVDLICASITSTLLILRETANLWRFSLLSGICGIYYYLSFALSAGSTLLITGVAVDRYIHTCRPLSSFYTVKKSKILCWSILFFSIMSSLPAAFGLFVFDHKSMSCQVNPDLRVLNDIISVISVFVFIVMFAVVSVCYTKVSWSLRRRSKQKMDNIRSRLSRNKSALRHLDSESCGTIQQRRFKLFSVKENKINPLNTTPIQVKPSDKAEPHWYHINRTNSLETLTHDKVFQNTAESSSHQDMYQVPTASRQTFPSIESISFRAQPASQSFILNQSGDSGGNSRTNITSSSTRLVSKPPQTGSEDTMLNERNNCTRSAIQDDKKQLEAESWKVKRTTLIMFSVTVVYISTWVIHWLMFGLVSGSTHTGVAVIECTKTLYMLNCMTNPIFYISLSFSFRRNAKRLFCKENM